MVGRYIHINHTPFRVPPLPELFVLTCDGYLLLVIYKNGEGLTTREYKEKGLFKQACFEIALRRLTSHGLIIKKKDGKTVRLYLSDEAREIAKAIEEFRKTTYETLEKFSIKHVREEEEEGEE